MKKPPPNFLEQQPTKLKKILGGIPFSELKNNTIFQFKHDLELGYNEHYRIKIDNHYVRNLHPIAEDYVFIPDENWLVFICNNETTQEFLSLFNNLPPHKKTKLD